MYDLIYPNIPIIKSAEETKAILDKNLNHSRVQEMMSTKDNLGRELSHYIKLNKRWKHVGSVLKISTLTVVGVTGTAATVTSSLVVPPLVPIIIGAFTVAEPLLLGGFIMWAEKKKKKFNAKCKILQSYLDRMYVYIEKVKQDGVITIEELEGFRHLVDECRSKLDVSTDIDIDAIRKNARKEVQKDFQKKLKEDIIAQEKQELIGKLESRLPAVANMKSQNGIIM